MSNRILMVIAMTFNQENLVKDASTPELLVCDDASTDGTITVCERWLAENGVRFHDTRFVSNDLDL